MMEGIGKQEKPEVYSVMQKGNSWQISRRDFLKAAGLGAAVMGAGMHTRFVKPVHGQSDLDQLCQEAPSHQNPITDVIASAEGKYLLTIDEKDVMKCWDFNSQALLSTGKAKDGEIICTAFLDGQSMAIRKKDTSFESSLFPDMIKGNVNFKTYLKDVDHILAADIDHNGNFYGITENRIFLVEYNSGAFDEQKVIYTLSDSNEKFVKISVISAGESLFVLKEKGFGVFDIPSGNMNEYENGKSYGPYMPLPGGSKVLVCEKDSGVYRLVSLADGHVIWEGNTGQNIQDAAVTPDGSLGILAGGNRNFILVSMQDGAEVHKLTIRDTKDPKIAVSKNGRVCAFSVQKSLLFVSLPDFEIIGCPIDLDEMVDTSKGIEIQSTDPDTGQTTTYTLPCNASIPQGAVCVCNCVQGEVCSCVGHVCSCVGYVPCACDAECGAEGSCGCDGDYSHYWYPD